MGEWGGVAEEGGEPGGHGLGAGYEAFGAKLDGNYM